jgi:hypothetical protein
MDVVTLTIEPGQTLEHYRFFYTDEGWSEESETWIYREWGVIERYSMTGGVDCDGKLESYHESQCRIDCLDAINHQSNVYPAWEKVKSSQRDHFAGSMGY